MTIRRTRNPVGIELTPNNIQGIGGADLTREGEIATDSSDSELKVRLDAATRTVVTEDQTQVLTNKTIDADLNTISDLEVDNLKSGVLNVSTTLSGASDAQIPSALAVKTYVDNGLALQNQAIEISVTPAGTIIATNVQAAIEELDGDIQGHINDTVDAHDASAISNTPAGNLAATDIQGAVNELQGDIDTNATAISNHISDTVDAHDASAISNSPSGNLVATDVQSALNEIQTDVDTRATATALTTHINDTANPHVVTKTQVGLGNVDNTSDVNKPVSTAQQTALDLKVNTTGGSIIIPARLDMKQDTFANLTTYALTATNGQLVFATDTKDTYVVKDGALSPVGGGGGGTLAALSDVTIATPLENQVLTYDSGTSTWINQANTLQQVYENSATSEITTNSTNGAVDIKRGSASDSDDVLRILNNAGVVVAQTNALGQHNTMYSSPENMLKNGSLELPSIADWTCTVGTCTRTTTSGEYSHGNAALKVALSAQAMNVSQTVTTPSGIQKQGFARVIYRVPSTMADFQVCTLVDAAEQTCVPTANLIKDDTFRSIEIPLTFGATSAGIKFKTTSAYTANAYFDGAILAQGLGLQNLQGDTEYSAQANISAVVSQLNKPSWIGNGSIVGAIYTYPITGFTVAPNCWAVNTTHGAGSGRLLNTQSTANTVAVEVTNTSGATASTTMSIGCQKSGNDYLAASSNVYSQASANTDWAACTFSTLAWQGLGTVTNNSLQCRRSNGMLGMRGKITVGTVTASTIQIPLPTNFGTITSASTIGTNEISGMMYRITATANTLTTAILQPSVSYFNVAVSGLASTTASANTPGAGSSTFGTGETFEFAQIEIPISGWTNSSAIVGSFAELGIKLQTSTATTSGTSVDYTIPVGVKRVTVMFNGVSTNGTSDIVIRLGSGSITSSGYVGSTGAIRSGGTSNAYAFSTAFNVNVETLAADNFSGISNFNLTGSNTWTMNGSIGSNTASRTSVSGGYVPLSGAIDRLRITTANGTDVFDAGSVNVSWEY